MLHQNQSYVAPAHLQFGFVGLAVAQHGAACRPKPLVGAGADVEPDAGLALQLLRAVKAVDVSKTLVATQNHAVADMGNAHAGVVQVLPVPVAPMRIWAFSPPSMLSTKVSMAWGWSPDGEYLDTSFKFVFSISIYHTLILSQVLAIK